jgi:hypothetical protein
MSAFHAARQARERGRPLTVDAVLAPSRASLAQKESLALWAVRSQPARVTICYIPVVDEFNHAWLELS